MGQEKKKEKANNQLKTSREAEEIERAYRVLMENRQKKKDSWKTY
ncbi:hypothetical protein [Alkaliphilus hydrothermalis]|uniref:Molecular chaperone DnaJ n=1 Tax=Alkaliphilus hydrothermalis TaxID=1482730 RepID=A0ABS2NUN1_9FIRM|nr:hypothetical protein [Alkaliphilus hydrothermalis]MBM7616284.1 hypothetical protein [Alkaliphilus hydrothermalis]